MENKNKLSALQEKSGIEPPEIVSNKSAREIQTFRKIQPTSKQLIDGILLGNIAALSRAITLIESTNAEHLAKATDVINSCLPFASQSIRIGITGVPGVGKSTFIESFGLHLTSIGKKVAVLAIDPSSTISHGSILGDKTRMEELVKNNKAYIRPSASGETLGGVARKTRETITLCESAGFDVIIIETVGVGQSETAVHSMVDFFLLLKIAGAGDELQGIKRGIMEMADAIVINKTDGDNIRKSQLAKTEFGRALHLFPAKKSGWTATSSTCSAITNQGISEVWSTILEFENLTKSNKYFFEKRKEQNQYWMLETINEQLKSNFYDNATITELLEKNKIEVQNDLISPFEAAQQLLENYFKSTNI
ncbi:MAG: methylmalonyl Co-A mutase-associated GTPase MeaB [Flavobacterium sp.]|nr:methylmalonyl Co-A mutase-associated GTPase MeaB [Flavobacterium sp.]